MDENVPLLIFDFIMLFVGTTYIIALSIYTLLSMFPSTSSKLLTGK
jgi:hypothetical protein